MSEATTVPAATAPGSAKRPVDYTWSGFLVAAFVTVGLVGLFATFAAPLPLQRGILRESALDAAQVAAHAPDPAAALAALGDRLDESADALIRPGGGVWPDLDARIAAERIAMRARMTTDEHALATRLRWLICLVTVMGAAFGVAILAAGRRG